MGGDPSTRAIGPFSVYPIGFGAARVSIEGRPDWETGLRVVMAAVEAGMTFIDTADAYCLSSAREHGYGERLVASALARLGSAADAVIVATKGGEIREGGAWKLNGQPDHLRSACKASLRAMGVDQIDLYQLHRPDPAVPLAESLGALTELQDEGLVREIGVCNVTEGELRAACDIGRIVSVQNPLAFDTKGQERILDFCERQGLAFLAHSPFGGPRRAARIRSDDRISALASSTSATSHQVALAALLARSEVVIPIPGTTRPERPRNHASAAAVELPQRPQGDRWPW